MKLLVILLFYLLEIHVLTLNFSKSHLHVGQMTKYIIYSGHNSGSAREGGGGKWNTNIPEKKSTKYPKIPQIPPNISKNNQSFEYFIPEIRC